MTCDCRDHDCSTSTDVGGSSAFDRIEQALSDPRKLGYVALMSGGTLAWYAMPDFVRSRPVRGVLKAGLLGGITAALASMFSCEDHRAFVGNCDEGARAPAATKMLHARARAAIAVKTMDVAAVKVRTAARVAKERANVAADRMKVPQPLVSVPFR